MNDKSVTCCPWKMQAVQFLVLLGFSLATGKVSYRGHQVHRIFANDQNEAQYLKSLEKVGLYDFWTDVRPGKHVDVRTSPEDAKALEEWIRNKGLESTIMIKDVEALIELEANPADNASLGRTMDWTSYHSLEDIYDWFDYLEAKFDFCEKEIIGKSYEGQDMIVMKVCREGCGNKPAMWIDSGIHAREWISPAVGTFMLNELIENDADHPELIENLDWYFLPSHNPDGYRVTRNDDRMWRKTTTKYPGDACQGTDANRNWDYHWGENGASPSSCSQTYHGPEPFSEVETRNVRDFVSARKDNIKFYQTLHSYSQFILMPWGYTEMHAPGYEAMLDLGYRGNEALYAQHHQFYEVGCIPCILYTASGTSLDWALGVAGIPYVYSIELRDTGHYGFLLPANQIIPTGEEVWAFHMIAAQQMIKEFVEK